MLDYLALRLLLRARLVTLSVCDTGSTTLSTTTTGFHRTAGSFITDGFAVGMEVSSSGFAGAANNGAFVVGGVTATDLTITGALTAGVAAAGRRVVSGLPTSRVWDNLAFTPTSGVPYIEEDFVTDNPSVARSFPALGGIYEATPLYVIRWFGIADIGTAAVEKGVGALLTLFKFGTVFPLANSDVARVRGDMMPSRTRLNEDQPGFVRCTVTIPLRVISTN